MSVAAKRYTQGIVESEGWRSGTSLENLVAHRLSRWGLGPNVTTQQHRVGPYRIDFAWPVIRVALEADGWQHGRPATAAKDALRDRYLRSRGWLVFRVDDEQGEHHLLEQLVRVVVLVKAMLSDDRLAPPSNLERA